MKPPSKVLRPTKAVGVLLLKVEGLAAVKLARLTPALVAMKVVRVELTLVTTVVPATMAAREMMVAGEMHTTKPALMAISLVPVTMETRWPVTVEALVPPTAVPRKPAKRALQTAAALEVVADHPLAQPRVT